MKSKIQAKEIWDTIPKKNQLMLLNNVFCRHCGAVRGVSEPTFVVEDGALIILGSCVKCNNRCVRLVEVDIKKGASSKPSPNSGGKTNKNTDIMPRSARVTKLTAYAKSSKFYGLLRNMPPLQVNGYNHLWKISDYELFDEDDQFCKKIYAEVIEMGDRPCWEMEQILPGMEEYADELNDPILEGIEIHAEIGFDSALDHFKKLIDADPRCLDAYTHIGNMYFHLDQQHYYSTAKSYYKQGVAIALQAIGDRLNDVFLWGMINNRPFLRCMEGFGLCLLKQDKIDDALDIFKQMLLLNPLDNQGVRFMIADHIR